MYQLRLVPLEGLYQMSSSESSLSTNSLASNASSASFPPTHELAVGGLCSLIVASSANTGERNEEGQEHFQIIKVRILQLVSEIFPEIEHSSQVTIEEIGSGSFNRVIGITIRPSQLFRDLDVAPRKKLSELSSATHTVQSPVPQEYVVRIPLNGRSECAGLGNDMKLDISILQVVGSHLDISIPKAIKYDLSNSNALKKPYVLQNRLQGQPLNVLMRKLNPQQMVSVVQRITKIIEKIAAITTPAAGMISTEVLVGSSTSNIELKQFPVPTPPTAALYPGLAKPCSLLSPVQTPLDFIVEQCQRWRVYEMTVKPNVINLLWDKILAVAHSLNRGGWLGDRFHLVHDDLFPRNILAEVKDSNSVEITGIVDWDISFFAPNCVAFRPPYWAWMGDGAEERDEDNARVEPEDDYDMLLWDAFVDTASSEFVRFAFTEESVLARKLFYVVWHGMCTQYGFGLAVEVVEQWQSMPSNQTPA